MKPLRGLLVALLVVAGLGMLAGCNKGNKPRPVSPDFTFSLNIAPVPEDWPLEDKDWHEDEIIAMHQQDTYYELGVPDWFYLFWRRDGRPMTQTQFQAQAWATRRNKDSRYDQPPRVGWIYLDEGIMVTFDKRGAEREPIDDTVRTLAEFGDPHEIKEEFTDNGGMQTTYQYYDEGRIVYFLDGNRTRIESTTPMPGWIWRR